MEGSGRKKGVGNKVTHSIRAMVETALSELGGVEYLKKVALDHPQSFCSLISKLIPQQVNAHLSGEGGVPLFPSRIEIVDGSPDHSKDPGPAET